MRARSLLHQPCSGPAANAFLAEGPDGDTLFPTVVEAERPAKAAERARRLEAETEIARLRELLAKSK